MKSNVENLNGLYKKLKIELPPDSVKEEFTRAYQELQKQTTLKGFRKGKAPLDRIKQMYSQNIGSEVARNLVQTTYFKALLEHKLDPVSYPKFNFEPAQENQSFNFSADFEVRPEIKIKKSEGLEVETEDLKIDSSKVDEVIKNIQNNFAEWLPAEDSKSLAKGDTAVIDFKGVMDGEPLKNGSAENHRLEIGSNQFIPGFEDGLVGGKKGETKTLNLKFPDEYQEETLKGKPVTFEVTINSIETKKLPELNEDLFKKVGNFSNLEDLKKDIQKDLEKNETRRIENKLKEDLIKAFIVANPVEIPETLLEDQKNLLMNNFKNRMQSQGFTDQNFEEYKEKWGQDFTDTAKQMIQSAFLVEQYAVDNKLTTTDLDLQKKYEEIAEQSKVNIEKVRQYYQQNNREHELKFQLMENKVFESLKAKAKIKRV